MENFIERLLKLINDVSGGNVSEFSKKSGIKQPTLHKYTKGRLPGAESLYALRNNLGVNINWLLTGEGEPYLKAEKGEKPAVEHNGKSLEGINDVYELKYIGVIRKFKNKPLAIELNEDLVDLEELSPDAYKKVVTYVKGITDGVRVMSEAGGRSGGDHAVSTEAKVS
jgi:transcriptional regulator with XRE-family HTH domain